jgi:hypothetical protein
MVGARFAFEDFAGVSRALDEMQWRWIFNWPPKLGVQFRIDVNTYHNQRSFLCWAVDRPYPCAEESSQEANSCTAA